MEYVGIEEIAALWGTSVRTVQILCKEGRIEGARRFGRAWMVPKGAHRPRDGRTREGRVEQERDRPLPRRTPFLYMSDLYRVPGTADRVAESLSDHREARILFEAEVAYSRGEIDRVYEKASYLLEKHSGFYAVLSAGMLLALCAIWRGDLEMWRRAKIHIAEAPCKTDAERDIMELSLSAVDIMLYHVESFPEWFKIGCFEPLHRDAIPAAKVYYAKYLYALAYALATHVVERPDMQGLSLMSVIPHALEPLISWARANGTVMSEIYLRMTTAAVYHNLGNDAVALRHLERAVELALPDRLLGLLAEYCRIMPLLIEGVLTKKAPEVWPEVLRLHRVYDEGWAHLSGQVRGKRIITTLTPKQREVAKLAAFGMSNQEIADHMKMSLSGVKQTLLAVTDKTGAGRREFAAFL